MKDDEDRGEFHRIVVAVSDELIGKESMVVVEEIVTKAYDGCEKVYVILVLVLTLVLDASLTHVQNEVDYSYNSRLEKIVTAVVVVASDPLQETSPVLVHLLALVLLFDQALLLVHTSHLVDQRYRIVDRTFEERLRVDLDDQDIP